MSYRDEMAKLPTDISGELIHAPQAAEIAARADARIAELEADAARYRYLASLMRGEPELIGDAYSFRWILPLGILSERTTLAAAIDAARVGNGGGV